jgi:hypothetical protein
MATEEQSASPLIVAGMHRSGTSLTASILQAGGVCMGERVLPPDTGNRRGYFEDVDFVQFHKNILRASGLSSRGWTFQQPVTISPEAREQAIQLGAVKAAHGAAWGWKDPRTTLFLPFWREVFPGAQFLFVFRAPWHTIDSLFRRRSDPEIMAHPRTALEYWVHYNQLVCDFVERDPERCAVVNVDALAADPRAVLALVNARFGRSAEGPVENCCDLRLLHRGQQPWRAVMIATLRPAAQALYVRLNAAAALPGPDWPAPAALGGERARDAFFEEWKRLRCAEQVLGPMLRRRRAAAAGGPGTVGPSGA